MKHLRSAAAGLAALMLTAGLTTAALAQDEPEAEMSPQPVGVFSIEGMNWLLTAQMVDGEMTPVPDGIIASLSMEDGMAGGSGGCNNWFSDYTLDGFELSFGAIGATQMFCEGAAGEVEQAYLANLGLVAAYQSGGIQMALLDADGEFLLEFDLAPLGSVVGDWVATGINNGVGGVVSSEMTTGVTATFTEDGQLSGSDGCNQYDTTYEIDGDSISIAPEIATTRVACEDEVEAQAQEYYAALANATTWSVDVQGNLELRDDSGALQVSYAPAGM
jgi:heat shock protein HslJ